MQYIYIYQTCLKIHLYIYYYIILFLINDKKIDAKIIKDYTSKKKDYLKICFVYNAFFTLIH